MIYTGHGGHKNTTVVEGCASLRELTHAMPVSFGKTARAAKAQRRSAQVPGIGLRLGRGPMRHVARSGVPTFPSADTMRIPPLLGCLEFGQFGGREPRSGCLSIEIAR